MATLKCLACGQDNRVAEESCTRCSSSLNLRLCSGCEAINDHTADRCHSCGEAFADDVSAPTPAEEPAAATQPPQAEPTRVEATKVEATLEFAMVDDPSAPRSLPARRLIDPPPRRGARFVQVAVLWAGAIVLGVGAAYAYHQYQVSGWPAVSGLISPKVVAAPKPSAASAPVTPALEPVEIPAVAKPVAPKIAQSSAAQATARVEPKQSMAPVTHTRAGSAAGETQPPARSSVPAPVAAAAAAAAVVAPAASASAPATARRARVTHTRAPEPGQAAAAAASAPAAVIQPSIEKPMNPNPSTCAPAVAALGLCISK